LPSPPKADPETDPIPISRTIEMLTLFTLPSSRDRERASLARHRRLITLLDAVPSTRPTTCRATGRIAAAPILAPKSGFWRFPVAETGTLKIQEVAVLQGFFVGAG
jgi:hypothetical protein